MSKNKAEKDPSIAAIVALLGGLFGLCGLGHIYAGEVKKGLLVLLGGWILIGIIVVCMMFLIGFCMLPLSLIYYIWQAYDAYKIVKGE